MACDPELLGPPGREVLPKKEEKLKQKQRQEMPDSILLPDPAMPEARYSVLFMYMSQ